MSKLDSFLFLTEHFNGKTITVQAEQCLNARFRQVGCTRCEDFCPGNSAIADGAVTDGAITDGAITLHDGQPDLNSEACLHCGLCLHRCPTGVFIRPDQLSPKLIKTVAGLPSGPVDLICPLHPDAETGPALQAVQTQRCLAALSPATLLAMAVHGRELWLDDTCCAECPLSKIHPALVETVAEAKAWGSLIEDAGPILLRSRQAQPPPPANRPIYQADQPSLSRRGFFTSLKQLGQEGMNVVVAEEFAQPVKSAQSTPVSERLPQFPPRTRMQVLAILDQAQASSQETPPLLPEAESQPTLELPIVALSIDPNRCSACGLCARFCPTGALAFVRDGDRFGLAFQPRLCLGQACDICRLACPEEAVSTSPAFPVIDLLKKKPQLLLKGNLIACQKCGQPVAVRPEQPALCFACRPKWSRAGLRKFFT